MSVFADVRFVIIIALPITQSDGDAQSISILTFEGEKL